MQDILLEKWGSDIITGDRKAPKPSLIGFRNTIQAVELLRKHILNGSKIIVHCDVDMDGIGSGYIMKKFLEYQGIKDVVFMINKNREHGVQAKHVQFINNSRKFDLLIVLDSSSNDLDIIRRFECDVLVIDHHELMHDTLYFKDKHEYIIVSNMMDNLDNEEVNEWLKSKNKDTDEKIDSYKADERMSGGLVLYELLRVYCESYGLKNLLENLMLYQWVGITLFSDAVLLAPDRNQWYIENTVYADHVESTLQTILRILNPYKNKLDKSYICYTFVPIINKAIRAGQSGKTLDIILNNPGKIEELVVYKDYQDEVMNSISIDESELSKDYILKDITNKNINRNYCGVIAAHLCGEYGKNAAVYVVNDGIAEGSFRGRLDADYRSYFEEYGEDVFAQGHKAAFGFKLKVEKLEEIMKNISSIEDREQRVYLTAGNVDEVDRGIHHIDDMDEFKRQRYLIRLAVGNSKLSSAEQIDIIASIKDAVLVEQRGKLYIYDILGLRCKAFEPLQTDLVSIYAEFSDMVELYIKNYRVRRGA
jgi:single-stranded DNA-specific DHH superfamily exonuclease